MSTASDSLVTRHRFKRARHRGSHHQDLLIAAVTVAVALIGFSVFLATAERSAPSLAPSSTEIPPPAGSALGADSASTATGERSPAPADRQPTEPPRQPTQGITYPTHGEGDWDFAGGRGPIGGTGGPLLRYRVAVEKGIAHLDVDDFADQVSTTLSDPRSWVGSGRTRLQRVDGRDTADFVVYLATPATRDTLCSSGRDRYTSCRNGDRVVINVARWAHGAVSVGVDLAGYRQYVVNHEVGHRLGHGHELCPGPGQPAPVMQQQTLGMHGCRPNAWPIRGGKTYRGPVGTYDDLPPTSDQ